MAETEAPKPGTIPEGINYPVRYSSPFVACPESHMILVVRGKGLHKIIHRIKGWGYNFDFRFFPITRFEAVGPITAIARMFNYDPVGIWPFGIYQYPHEWTKFGRIKPDGTEIGLKAHQKELIYITPFEYQYGMQFKGVEVGGEPATSGTEKKARLLEVDFELSVRTRMVNPKQALMTNKDWFSVLTVFMQTLLKDFVGTKSYSELVTKAKNGLSAEFFTYVEQNQERIVTEVGVEVYEAFITSITPDEEYEEAIKQVAIEEEKARQRIIIANAEAESRERLAQVSLYERQREAEGIERIAEADERRIRQTALVVAGGPGANAVQFEKWRQIHESGLTTYVEGGAETGVNITPQGKP